MSDCKACGYANTQSTKFCVDCGLPLDSYCPTCGNSVTASQKFCGECGLDLRGSAAPARTAESERKQVTVLFADLARSMDLAERFDPDQWTQIVTGLFEAGAAAVRRYGGTVDKFTGDGLMALFGAPVAQEDHASRAARAALALVAAAQDYAAKVRAEHGIDLHVRAGLNSGEVVAGDVGDSGFTAVGHTVGLAQRMESCAELDCVNISEHTARLLGSGFTLRDPGRISVKGASEPIGVFVLQLAAGPMESVRRRLTTTRLVGRQPEIDVLRRALDDALASRAQVIGIVGEAGAGKSRLTEELAALAADRGVTVRRTAGVSHAPDVSLLPIRMLFADYFGIAITDTPEVARERVESALLRLDPTLADDLPVIFEFLEVPDPDRPAPPVGPAARRRRILATIRRVTLRRSETSTVVFVLEDLHWFDPDSVAFLDEWLPSFPGTRTLIVTNFRPEFSAPWAQHSYYRQIPLAGLDADATRSMVTHLLGDDPSLGPLAEDVAGRAGGNPLFVEEMVRDLVEDSTLEGAPGGYVLTRAIESVRMPMSVHAVLAGRIDRLDPTQKQLLQAAAVIGRTFAVGVLAAVLGTTVDDLHSPLHELCRAELLQQTGENEFRFWHPLTQEVAYSSLLSATRRRRHRAVADALIQFSPERVDELSPLIATHMEQAEDKLEAGRWQSRAAARAAKGDIGEVIRRMRAAIRHLDGVGPDHHEEAIRLSVWARSFLIRVATRAGLDPEEVHQLTERARADAEQIGDPVSLIGLSMAEGVFQIFSAGHAGRSRDAMLDAMERSRSAGDRGLEAWAFGAGGAAHCFCGPVDEGLSLIRHGLDICADDPSVGLRHAGYSVSDAGPMLQGMLYMAGGQLDQARQILNAVDGALRIRIVMDWLVWNGAQFATLADLTGAPNDLAVAEERMPDLLRLAEDTGSAMSRVVSLRAQATIDLLRGRPELARERFAEALATLRERRSGRHEEVTVLANLARTHLLIDDPAPATRLAGEAIALAAERELNFAGCHAHAVLAEALRMNGDGAEARAALDAGRTLALKAGATTWFAILDEERARLENGDLGPIAEAYDAIGATGHAARMRAELSG